jgi:hypothetical protein
MIKSPNSCLLTDNFEGRIGSLHEVFLAKFWSKEIFDENRSTSMDVINCKKHQFWTLKWLQQFMPPNTMVSDVNDDYCLQCLEHLFISKHHFCKLTIFHQILKTKLTWNQREILLIAWQVVLNAYINMDWTAACYYVYVYQISNKLIKLI